MEAFIFCGQKTDFQLRFPTWASPNSSTSFTIKQAKWKQWLDTLTSGGAACGQLSIVEADDDN